MHKAFLLQIKSLELPKQFETIKRFPCISSVKIPRKVHFWAPFYSSSPLECSFPTILTPMVSLFWCPEARYAKETHHDGNRKQNRNTVSFGCTNSAHTLCFQAQTGLVLSTLCSINNIGYSEFDHPRRQYGRNTPL